MPNNVSSLIVRKPTNIVKEDRQYFNFSPGLRSPGRPVTNKPCPEARAALLAMKLPQGIVHRAEIANDHEHSKRILASGQASLVFSAEHAVPLYYALNTRVLRDPLTARGSTSNWQHGSPSWRQEMSRTGQPAIADISSRSIAQTFRWSSNMLMNAQLRFVTVS